MLDALCRIAAERFRDGCLGSFLPHELAQDPGMLVLAGKNEEQRVPGFHKLTQPVEYAIG